MGERNREFRKPDRFIRDETHALGGIGSGNFAEFTISRRIFLKVARARWSIFVDRRAT